MTEDWRWDQGRLEYFRFDNIRKIAKCLLNIEGIKLNVPDLDPLRNALESETGLPFSPNRYKVWRNYSRVFACSLLATRHQDLLVVTDLCRKIASTGTAALTVDEYLSFMIPRFYFPFPAFQGYSVSKPQIFPFCAILRYLIAQFYRRGEAHINIDEVFSLMVPNCHGTEDIDFYLNLSQSDYTPSINIKRQVREMLIFISQISFLKWYGNVLFLDVMPADIKAIEALEGITTPIIKQRNRSPSDEILTIGMTDAPKIVTPVLVATRDSSTDVVFTEGKRVRVEHVRTERSPRLRKMFFASMPEPHLCDMCGLNPKRRYPWTENILEIHHILPLTSPLTITLQGTSFDDVVGVCPNCHRSVHAYYKAWLNTHSQEDFNSRSEAKEVYLDAKERMVL